MNFIQQYFPHINKTQKSQLAALYELYTAWNSKINVISRKDMDYFYLHHVLHSLAIAKFIRFQKGCRVMDVGTGGGFPGVPLAIMFPEVKFHLVDSIGKKIKVINAVAQAVNLQNINTHHQRMEDLNFEVDFVVCRAVAPLKTLVNWAGDKIATPDFQKPKNGFLCLKGGDLTAELEGFEKATVIRLSDFFKEPFFETKKLLYWPVD